MYKVYIILSFLLLSLNIQGQTLKPEIYNPPLEINNQVDWGTDVVISPTEPFGRFSGVQKSNGTIYLAIPDTSIVSNRCLVILSSTNLGVTWSIGSSVQPAGIVSKAKMVRTGLDSIYCFFLYGTSIYCWNIQNNNFNMLSGIFRDFDACGSSTGALYCFEDLLASNSIPRVASINGFATVSQTGTVTSTGANPRISMSPAGDTLLLAYYNNPTGDTISSALYGARYRQTTSGSLSVTGSFATYVAAGTPKSEFMPVLYGINCWLYYTTGLTGSIDLKCVVSTNNGASFGSEIPVGGNPNVDEYWFDAKAYTGTSSTGGCDVIYYSDSLQSGPPSNNTDKINYRYSNNTTPFTFSPITSISGYPPGWSSRGYIPGIIELENADLGAVWVGIDGSTKKIYWDRYGAVVGIKENNKIVPDRFSLSQNYPNPFNPTTKIEFTLPIDEFVAIKIYDVLGKEAAVLINKDMKKGTYEIEFNASQLSSGIYFYKMTAGGFTDVKKMVLMK